MDLVEIGIFLSFLDLLVSFPSLGNGRLSTVDPKLTPDSPSSFQDRERPQSSHTDSKHMRRYL